MTSKNPLADLDVAFRATLRGSPAPEPIDLYSGHLGQRATLASGLLPPVVERLAFDAADRMASAPGPIALAAICAAAGAIRAGWRISGHRNNRLWIEPPVIWGAISGGVSRKKTSLVRTATGPLRPIQAEWQKTYAEDLRDWKRDEACYNSELAKWKAGKGDEPNPLPEAPGRPMIVVGDTTIEALGDVCHHNPAGVLQERDELTGWLAGMTAYTSGKSAGGGSPARSAMLEAWNAVPYDVLRVGRGYLHVPSFGVSVVGGIQDDKVRDHFEGDSDGLLARFLFAEAPRPSDISRDLPDDQTAANAWRDALSALANSAAGQVVELSAEATQFRAEMERRAKAIDDAGDSPKSWVAHSGKWAGIFLRLCLILHLIEHADLVGAERPVPEVSGDLAGRVFRLMTDWFEPEAARIHFSILNRTQDRRTGGDLETIADLILRRGKGRLTWGDVSRDIRPLRVTDPVDGWRLLDTLASHGWLSARQGGNKPFWIVNPAVFELFRERRMTLTGKASVKAPAAAAPSPAPLQDIPVPTYGDRELTIRENAVLVRAEMLADWLAEIGPVCEPDLVDPLGEPDAEEAAASMAAYAEMAAGYGTIQGRV